LHFEKIAGSAMEHGLQEDKRRRRKIYLFSGGSYLNAFMEAKSIRYQGFGEVGRPCSGTRWGVGREGEDGGQFLGSLIANKLSSPLEG
jgi:hypothetical protein